MYLKDRNLWRVVALALSAGCALANADSLNGSGSWQSWNTSSLVVDGNSSGGGTGTMRPETGQRQTWDGVLPVAEPAAWQVVHKRPRPLITAMDLPRRAPCTSRVQATQSR